MASRADVVIRNRQREALQCVTTITVAFTHSRVIKQVDTHRDVAGSGGAGLASSDAVYMQELDLTAHYDAILSWFFP